MFCLLSGATPEFAVVTLGPKHIDCALGYQGGWLPVALALSTYSKGKIRSPRHCAKSRTSSRFGYLYSLDGNLQVLNMYLVKPNFAHVYIIEPITLEALTT